MMKAVSGVERGTTSLGLGLVWTTRDFTSVGLSLVGVFYSSHMLQPRSEKCVCGRRREHMGE